MTAAARAPVPVPPGPPALGGVEGGRQTGGREDRQTYDDTGGTT
ncbi:hypothetical protein SFR_6218 [Streptomyces sp. FR-008]|nr:hypothetical protein SFR_6218 [Streptomyces sp. FR-008]